MASMFLYVVFNMLAGKNGNLDMYKCLSLIGYCMLPIVMLSAFSLFVPQGGMVIMVITGLFVIWSTRVCTGLVVELANCGDEHRGLITSNCIAFDDSFLKLSLDVFRMCFSSFHIIMEWESGVFFLFFLFRVKVCGFAVVLE
ncbi:UNVERIFIED_CONTAM: protein YIPF5 [Sesamum angustifolium]|uniref:Protein YIP n=1 Tax=Sesamum angustifolium TaxID=2727405 RepID=A0AAW2LDS6_9LAMI